MSQIERQLSNIKSVFLSDFVQTQRFLDGTDASCDVFLTLDWYELLSQHGLVGGGQPCLLGLSWGDTADARCVLPLLVRPGTLSSLSNFYSSLYGPAGAQGAPAEAWRVLAGTLRQQPSSDVLQLQPLDEDAAWLAQLRMALRQHGYWMDRFECFGNWYLPVRHACFADYMATVPSPLRNSIARGRRRLARVDGMRLSIHQDADEHLDAAIADFQAIYRHSWKQAEPCPQFMPGLIRLAARRGWLRLGVLHIEGRAVAAQVWLVQQGKANIYKLAYVQGYERFSPGSVLTAALMEHVMDVDRVQEVDYLTGDDAYKRDWMSHRRVRVGLVAFRWSRPRGLLAAARHFGGRAVRRLQARLTLGR
ncbi:GNAT family N-acetyltransferase [Pseudorhodoferax sp.]|uniref:GNAT family N-acetyltransferase n=1 Tax=Pseudorhodoferax sp. TaxID=1993553 RepID=UPI0039E58EE6